MGLNEIIKIGDKIKYYRKNLKITQAEMAAKLELPRSTYAHYENNTREPSTEILDKIANILGISKFDLLYDIDKLKEQLYEVENKSNSKDYFLEQYIHTLGYEIIKEMENGYLILKSKDGEYEITQNDIDNLENNSKSFIEYNLYEIIKRSRKVGK